MNAYTHVIDLTEEFRTECIKFNQEIIYEDLVEQSIIDWCDYYGIGEISFSGFRINCGTGVKMIVYFDFKEDADTFEEKYNLLPFMSTAT